MSLPCNWTTCGAQNWLERQLWHYRFQLSSKILSCHRCCVDPPTFAIRLQVSNLPKHAIRRFPKTAGHNCLIAIKTKASLFDVPLFWQIARLIFESPPEWPLHAGAKIEISFFLSGPGNSFDSWRRCSRCVVQSVRSKPDGWALIGFVW